MKIRALIIGRYQPFHKGHLKALKYVSKKVDQVIIVIGSSQYSNTIENPFTAKERKEMIEKSLNLPKKKYNIVMVPDVNNDNIWVPHVVKLVPKFHVVYTNSPLEGKLFKKSGFEVKDIPFFNRKKYSATEVRKRLIEGKSWQSLVPKGTLEVIKQVNGVNRIKKIYCIP